MNILKYIDKVESKLKVQRSKSIYSLEKMSKNIKIEIIRSKMKVYYCFFFFSIMQINELLSLNLFSLLANFFNSGFKVQVKF